MGHLHKPPLAGAAKPSYDADAYGWAMEQAALLRAGRIGEADILNIAEEIEDLGRAERRELTSALRLIAMHLLKWDRQPERRSRSWALSTAVQRKHAAATLRDNPSLKAALPALIEDAYAAARIEAAQETGLPLRIFPEACPYSFDDLMDRPVEWPE